MVKNISDKLVIKAYLEATEFRSKFGLNLSLYPYDYLMKWTGLPEKVCYRAMERAEKRGYIDCGVSLRTGWVTEKGLSFFKTK